MDVAEFGSSLVETGKIVNSTCRHECRYCSDSQPGVELIGLVECHITPHRAKRSNCLYNELVFVRLFVLWIYRHWVS
jgi:hypothetical protein